MRILSRMFLSLRTANWFPSVNIMKNVFKPIRKHFENNFVRPCYKANGPSDILLAPFFFEIKETNVEFRALLAFSCL